MASLNEIGRFPGEFPDNISIPSKENPYGYRKSRRNLLLSSGAVNAARATPQKPESDAAFGLCATIKTFSKSSAGKICVLAAQGGAFKKCCLKSGRFDGSNRNYFFPRLTQATGSARYNAR
jgi:hypothetical protein